MDPVAIVEDRINLARVDITLVAPIAAYTSEIIAGVAEELNRIDDVIAEYLAENWELSRISAVDRAILRVAVWEMIFNPDVPVKTALSEAVELASQYSGASAPAYINAVLDSVVKNIGDLRRLPVGVSEVDDTDEVSFADALAQAGEEPDDAGADLGEHFDSDEWDESPKPPTAESAESDDLKPDNQPAKVVGPEEPAKAEAPDVSAEPTEAGQPDTLGESAAEFTDPDVSYEPGGESAQTVGGKETGEVADALTEPTEPVGESTETTE